MRYLCLLLFCMGHLCSGVNAQNDDSQRLADIEMSQRDTAQTWTIGGGLGADIGNILVINPKPGSGQNRLGFGGAIGFFANHLKGRFTWDNNVSLNLGLEKTGSGVLPIAGESITVPFRKTIDDLRLSSTAGFRFSDSSKWAYAADLTFRSQFTPSYLGVEDGQVYAKSINQAGPYQTSLVSQFLSPARITFGLGLKYDPSPQLSFLFAPATADLTVIENQYIANLGIHGTELVEGSTTEYEKTRLGIGAKLGIKYTQAFLEDRFSFSSRLALFSDYVNEPENVDVDWTNELSLAIVKNLQLSYLSNVYYDDHISSYVTDFDAPGGLKADVNGDPILRPTTNYYHQIVLKYTKVF